jgi:hypothetical protein
MLRYRKYLLSLLSAALFAAAALTESGTMAAQPSTAATVAGPNRLHIMSAGFYGYRAGERLGNIVWDPIERAVAKECEGKVECSITASGDWFRARDNAYADPAPNQPKRAEIRYRCADGASGAYKFIPEGQSQTLSCSTL